MDLVLGGARLKMETAGSRQWLAPPLFELRENSTTRDGEA
jgi:hypothetical protein